MKMRARREVADALVRSGGFRGGRVARSSDPIAVKALNGGYYLCRDVSLGIRSR